MMLILHQSSKMTRVPSRPKFQADLDLFLIGLVTGVSLLHMSKAGI
jgi:hypothetical protein